MHKIAELFCALTSSLGTEAELIVDCAIFSNLRQSLIAFAEKMNIREYSFSSWIIGDVSGFAFNTTVIESYANDARIQ